MGKRGHTNGEIVRPVGWNACNDVPDSWKRADHLYRGMTSEEFSAHLRAGYLKSNGRYSAASEGTCFTDDPGTGEGYVNFGRDDPRKTGKPTYLAEVPLATDLGFARDRDGYWKTHRRIPLDRLSRVWEMTDEGGAIVARLVTLERDS